MKFTRKIRPIRPKAFPNDQNANADNLDWIHCVGWRLRHDLEDPWTAFVMNAKAREPSSVKNAAECMAIYVKSLQLKHKHIYVVPIISSGDEQACEDDPSTVFSRTVAEAVGGICVVDALEKQPYSSLHSGRKSAAERDSLVAGAYTCTGFDFPADCTEPLILIVDDIVTRGSTMNDAARAIRAKHGDLQIGGLALAKWQWQEDADNGYISEEILSAADLIVYSTNVQSIESGDRSGESLEGEETKSDDDLQQKRLRNIENGYPANCFLPWSDEDIELLINLYQSKMPIEKIAAQFERTVNSITRKLESYGVIDEEEIEHGAKEIFESAQEKEILGGGVGKTVSQQRLKNIENGYPVNSWMPWSDEDNELLIKLYESKLPIEEIAAQFERSAGAIRSQLKKLDVYVEGVVDENADAISESDQAESFLNGDVKEKVQTTSLKNSEAGIAANHGMPWSGEDVDLLTKLYESKMPIEKIAAKFERSANAIICQLERHELIDEETVKQQIGILAKRYESCENFGEATTLYNRALWFQANALASTARSLAEIKRKSGADDEADKLQTQAEEIEQIPGWGEH